MPEWLTRTVGPLPVWGWLAAVAAGLAMSYVLARRDGGSDDDDQGGDRPVGAVAGIPNVVPLGAGDYYGPAPAGDPAATPADLDDDPATLEEWARAALEALLAAGAEPLTADAAIRAYVAAQPLTDDQQRLVSMALGLVGPAPGMLWTPVPEVPSGDPGPDRTPGGPGTPGYEYSPDRQPDPTLPGDTFSDPGDVAAWRGGPPTIRPRVRAIYSHNGQTVGGATLERHVAAVASASDPAAAVAAFDAIRAAVQTTPSTSSGGGSSSGGTSSSSSGGGGTSSGGTSSSSSGGTSSGGTSSRRRRGTKAPATVDVSGLARYATHRYGTTFDTSDATKMAHDLGFNVGKVFGEDDRRRLEAALKARTGRKASPDVREAVAYGAGFAGRQLTADEEAAYLEGLARALGTTADPSVVELAGAAGAGLRAAGIFHDGG